MDSNAVESLDFDVNVDSGTRQQINKAPVKTVDEVLETKQKQSPTLLKQSTLIKARLTAAYKIVLPIRSRVMRAAQQRQYDRMFRTLEARGPVDQDTLNDLLFKLLDHDQVENLPLAIIERLLNQGASANTTRQTRWETESVLTRAVEIRSLEAVKLLIANGADVNYKNEVFWGTRQRRENRITSLALCGPDEILIYLLQAGMEPVLNVTYDGFRRVTTTVLHQLVASRGSASKVPLLIKHGAKLDSIDESWRCTPLMLALWYSERPLVAELIRNGAGVEIDVPSFASSETNSRYSIHWKNPIEAAISSCSSQSSAMVNWLFDAGARTGWLNALDQFDDILGNEPVVDRRFSPPENDQRDEIEDGYKVVLRRLEAIEASPKFLFEGEKPPRLLPNAFGH